MSIYSMFCGNNEPQPLVSKMSLPWQVLSVLPPQTPGQLPNAFHIMLTERQHRAGSRAWSVGYRVRLPRVTELALSLNIVAVADSVVVVVVLVVGCSCCC